MEVVKRPHDLIETLKPPIDETAINETATRGKTTTPTDLAETLLLVLLSLRFVQTLLTLQLCFPAETSVSGSISQTLLVSPRSDYE